MSSQALGKRFMVIRGGCWQCVPDCRSRLAEALTLFQVAPNVGAMRRVLGIERGKMPYSVCWWQCFSEQVKKQKR